MYKRKCGVYKIMSIIHPDRCYIGSSVTLGRRLTDHNRNLSKHKHNPILNAHVNKYGIDDLIFEIIEEFAFISKEYLLEREQYYLNFYRYPNTNKPYFNASPTANSCLGVKHSAEYRKNNSDRNKGEKNPHYGKKMSAESSMKKRLALTGLKRTPEQNKRNSESHKGKKMSPESIAKRSLSCSGDKNWRRQKPYPLIGLVKLAMTQTMKSEKRSRLYDQVHTNGKLRARIKKYKNKKMQKEFNITLSEDELRTSRIPTNFVLVKMVFRSEGAKTPSGLVIGFNTDLTYADIDNPDDRGSHEADLTEVFGIVEKTCDNLIFNTENRERSMPWQTDMQLKKGDAVWLNLIEAKCSTGFICKGIYYKIIPYADIYCARRNYTSEYNPHDGEVIMLNGFVLLEPLHRQKLSELDVLSESIVYEDRGIVCYLGKPNQLYNNNKDSDDIIIKEGELAYFKPGYTPFLMERNPYMNFFDKDKKLFWCVQRRRIVISI